MTNALPTELTSLAKSLWWFVLLRGILAIIFGIIALIAPSAALTGITFIFGAYVLIDGIAEIALATRIRKTDSGWGWVLFQGIVAVLAGLAALIIPAAVGTISGILVLWIVAIFALIHGVVGLVTASGVPAGPVKTWGIVGAAVTLLFAVVLGILLIVTPSATVLGFIWVVGLYALVFGVLLVVASLLLRRDVRKVLS